MTAKNLGLAAATLALGGVLALALIPSAIAGPQPGVPAVQTVPTVATATFGAAGAACTSSVDGQQGFGFFIAAGTLAATLTPEVTTDPAGTAGWTASVFVDSVGNTSSTQAFTNPSGAFGAGVALTGGARWARVRVSSYTSGSAAGYCAATQQASVGGAIAQGAAGTNAASWWTRIGDATNGPAAVKAGSTAAAAGDASLVVNISPNSPTHPVNLQLAGTAVDGNSGVKSAGTIRVVLATDQPQLTNKLLVTPDANSAVNVAQINGVAASMGNGVSGTGVQRVTLASDSTGQVALAAGSSVTSTGPLAQASTTSGQTGHLILAATATSTPSFSGGKSNPLSQLPDGHLRVTDSGDLQTSVTSTTATAATQWIAASGSNRTFVKFAQCSSSAASTTTTNEQCQLVYGTGTNCGTGTTLLAACFTPATGGCNWHDLVAPASQAICFRHAAAGTKLYTISYRQAP